MKSRNKIRYIAILMIISELILIGFVTYWLVGQYRSQKSIFHEELYQDFMTSQEAVIDSMLVAHVINPILNDSLGEKSLEIHMDSIHSQLQEDKQTVSIIAHPEWKGKVQKVNYTIDDSLQIQGKARFFGKNDLAENVILRSAKLVLQLDNSPNGEHITVDRMLMVDPDTIIFRKEFEKRLGERATGKLLTHWYTLSDSTEGPSKYKISFASDFNHPKLGVYISHFSGYLLIKILPQFLFALLLVFLTGFAFVFTYLSLYKQLDYNRIRDEFIGNISHELKTPVSTVKIAIEAIRNYRAKEDPVLMEDYLSMAASEVDRLDQLVEKVLNQATLHGGGIRLRSIDVDVSALLNTLVKTLGPRFEKENAKVFVRVEEGDYQLNLDPLLFQGVLINLIDNSLKYTSKPPVINIDLHHEGDYICLDIKDNGMGIPAEYKKKIFDKFFRIPTDNIHNIKGHGLGLSYASMVMDLHGGKITHKSNPEGGTIFSIRIPVDHGE